MNDRDVRRRHPPLGRSLRADGIAFAANRGERFRFTSRRQEWLNVARLLVQSGDFIAMALYRLRGAIHNAGVPILPTALRELCAWMFKARIGDLVVIEPGVYVPHGAITIEGEASIGAGCVITPWVTIRPRDREAHGPTIEPAVFIGSHSTIIGRVTIGKDTQIGAGAVVETDVPAGSVAAGVPARIIATGMPSRFLLGANDANVTPIVAPTDAASPGPEQRWTR